MCGGYAGDAEEFPPSMQHEDKCHAYDPMTDTWTETGRQVQHETWFGTVLNKMNIYSVPSYIQYETYASYCFNEMNNNFLGIKF